MGLYKGSIQNEFGETVGRYWTRNGQNRISFIWLDTGSTGTRKKGCRHGRTDWNTTWWRIETMKNASNNGFVKTCCQQEIDQLTAEKRAIEEEVVG